MVLNLAFSYFANTTLCLLKYLFLRYVASTRRIIALIEAALCITHVEPKLTA